MSEPFVSNKLQLLAPNPMFRALVGLGVVLGVAGFVAAVLLHLPLFAVPGFYALLASLIGGLYVRAKNPKPKRVDVEVRADARGLHAGELDVSRAKIKDGFILPRGADYIVQLSQTGFAAPIQLVAPDADTARGVLRALGLDASQTVAHFRTMSRALAHRKKLAIGGALVGVSMALTGPLIRHGHHAFVPLVAFLGMAIFLAFIAVPTHLEVGVDGLLLSWFGKKRFIRFEDVLDVARFSESFGRSRTSGVNVTLRSSEVVKIPIESSKWDHDRAAIIHERIREAIELHKSGAGGLDASILHRGDRNVAGWIENLKRLGVGANADARTAPIETERLLSIALDPAKKPTERAAAAVALGARGDEDTRARVREAARATAAPKLRVALDCAGDADKDAELEAALAELEQEEREQLKKELEDGR